MAELGPGSVPLRVTVKGNVMAAAAGANLRELRERMGDCTRAALVYLDSTDDRQRKVADALGHLSPADLKDNRT